MAAGKCECSDRACPVHTHKAECAAAGTWRLFRLDMEDAAGTLFCEPCGCDAFETGLFTDVPKGRRRP